MGVVGHRLRFRALGRRQIALVLNHLIRRGRAQIVFLGRRRSLLRELARLLRGVISCPCLLEPDHGVLDVDADLIDLLLKIRVDSDGFPVGW